MNALAAHRERLEKASEGLAALEAQRDATAAQLREQVAENATLRQTVEQMKAVAAERDARAGELGPLIELLRETCTQIAAKVGG